MSNASIKTVASISLNVGSEARRGTDDTVSNT